MTKISVIDLLSAIKEPAAKADEAWFTSKLAAMPAPGMKVSVNSRCIGPRHDPYDETTIMVEYGSKKASFMQNGLGFVVLQLYYDGKLGGTIEHCDPDTPTLISLKKMFAFHVGITVEGAHATYDRSYEQDPIGDQR